MGIGKKYNRSENGELYVYTILSFNKRDDYFGFVTLVVNSFQLIKSNIPVVYEWDHNKIRLDNDKIRNRVKIG